MTTFLLCLVAAVGGVGLGVLWGRGLWGRRPQRSSLLAVLGGGTGAVLLMQLDDRLAAVLATLAVTAGGTAVLVLRRRIKSSGLTKDEIRAGRR
jgi:hypothetical protein